MNSSYAYDHTTARVQMFDGTATTTYQTKGISYLGFLNGTSTIATTTKYLYGPGGDLLALVTSVLNGTTTTASTTNSTILYSHPDHLSSTSLITDENASSTQTTLYYPYGATQAQTGSSGLTRGYLGEYQDSTLSYLNARYMDNARGQFASVDPVFWNMKAQDIQLKDPQSWNGYAYSRNNPLVLSDRSGEFWWNGFYDWNGYEGWHGVAMKAGEVFGGHNRALNAIQQNKDSVARASYDFGVNSSLVNAVIYEEQSHLTPDEVLGREYLFPKIGVGGVGIMQVSEKVGKENGGYSKEELVWNSDANIRAGTSYLGTIQNSFSTQSQSWRIAEIGNVYNGSASYGQRISSIVSNPSYNNNIISESTKSLLNYSG